ncbi:hypothetical protein [Methyloversatilis sp. XJ19-49]|uniref:hypothetical protein n=1 Tax=Methyloversatilis sp. XJ19-49 TaxID=2963429 RepID=UPI00211CCA51|nr:hypothetical protein [Methyloversatilis sp. XJ19-49]MCQ9379500.1 hypothetical protein [Methyloversatilis sp. XJ19-49]
MTPEEMNKVLRTLYLLGGLVMTTAACSAQSPDMPPFDAAKAKLLSPERRAQLDVAFFNEFDTRREGPPTIDHPRAARVHEMAKEGFEIAFLAENIFNLGAGGVPRVETDVPKLWRRVKLLALAGDPSAQCLVWNAEPMLREEFSILPPPEPDEPTRYQMLEKAALDGHPSCMGDWGNYQYQNDAAARVQWNLKGAKKGCLICRLRLAFAYAAGEGVEKADGVAWCWILESWAISKANTVVGDAQAVAGLIQREFLAPSQQVKRYLAGTNCENEDPAGAKIDLKSSLESLVFGVRK